MYGEMTPSSFVSIPFKSLFLFNLQFIFVSLSVSVRNRAHCLKKASIRLPMLSIHNRSLPLSPVYYSKMHLSHTAIFALACRATDGHLVTPTEYMPTTDVVRQVHFDIIII